jgi:proline-specific peptidase
MPKAIIKGQNIYYEIYGKGEPLVLLNGIMMSTASWKPFIEVFSQDYELVLVDFLDQGQSDKATDYYTQDVHVEMLKELFSSLGFNKVNMVGISYGGEVALRFAVKYQEKLSSLVLANTTAYTTEKLKDIGEAWIYAAKSYNGFTFFKEVMPYVYSDDFYENNIKWLKEREKLFNDILTKEWYDGFIRLVKSAEDLNINDELDKINVPTMIIGAEKDTTTPIKFQEEIKKRIKNSRMVIIKDAGHASMYEKPYEFASIVIGFLKTYNKKIEIV